MSGGPCSFGLTDDGRDLLNRIQHSLPLLADLARADLLLYCKADSSSEAQVVAEAKPHSVPSIYSDSQLSKKVGVADEPAVLRVFARGKPEQQVRREFVRGSQTVQVVHPVKSGQSVVGALSTETSLVDRERQQEKGIVFQRAMAQLRRIVLQGQLEGGQNIGPIGEHDGSMVVDSRGQILYISPIAENLYRRQGLTRPLLGARLADLRTDESSFFKALESGVCVEDVVEEGPLVWVRKAIPLVASPVTSWWKRLREPEELDGVILVIQDITEERRKEQELKIKSAMIQEIHHRVKNNLQTIAALLRLQARRTGSEEVVDVLRQTINRILSVAVVHEFLSHDESSIINIKDVCQRILDEVTQGVLDPDKRIRIALEGSNIYLPAQQATSCALIVNELLQNAVEHGFSNRWEGTITITLYDGGNNLTLEIVDDGQGLPPGFSFSRGTNLGLQIVSTLAREDLKGAFELVNGSGSSQGGTHCGVRAMVTIPKAQRGQKVASAAIR